MSSLNTEIAELMDKDGVMYDVAEKVQYNRSLTAEEKEISEISDAWAKEIGRTGRDSEGQIAEYLNKVLNDEVYNVPDELLDTLFERGTIGEFDAEEYTKTPKNTLVVHESGKGGTVDRSWIDIPSLIPTTVNAQVETDVSYIDLRKNGFKSIALLTTFAKEALQNNLFYHMFSAIDSAIVGGDQVMVVSGKTPTQEAIDAFTLYLTDIDSSNALGVGLTKYMQQIGRMTGYSEMASEEMKNNFNRYGLIKAYDGVAFAGISSYKKTGNGQLLIPDKRIFGCAGTIGQLDMQGEIHTYEDMDNSNEKVIIRVKDFTYTYAITDIDKCCKMTFTD